MKNSMTNFREWLLDEKEISNQLAIDSIVLYIQSIAYFAHELDINRNLSEINLPNDFMDIINKLNKNKIFINQNNVSSDKYLKATNIYLGYLKFAQYKKLNELNGLSQSIITNEVGIKDYENTGSVNIIKSEQLPKIHHEIGVSNMPEKFNIEIGKYTLESLTTGMYKEPKIVYREYIQNSVDSLEHAVESQLIEKQSMRIDIVIDKEAKKISVYDNGTGIPKDIAVSTLIDIGNSKKRHTNNRGFRGIGRLGGMSYCNKLVFTTSIDMEDMKTVISFNCKKLRELLVPGDYSEYDLARVIDEITTIEILPERQDKHYFFVEMEEVNELCDLLIIDEVKKYISQVAPVPYSSRNFIWNSKIYIELSKYGYGMDEFPIFVGENQNDLVPIYKPNRHRFEADRKNRKKDEISCIKFFDVKDGEDILAVGWYGECSWFGTLTDDEIAGIRVRKGNILIGDSKTLNKIFKESRFNGWVQGELFIISNDLIPNARRDDFERNATYSIFINRLSNTIGLEISRIIREFSNLRNDNSAKFIEEAEKKVDDALKAVGEGFNSTVDKNKILEELNEGELILKKIKNSEGNAPKKIEVLNRIQEVKETVEDSRNFKINRINYGIDNKSKNVLKVVSDILSLKLAKFLVDEIIEEIIEKLNKR